MTEAEMQARILELEEENKTIKAEKDTLLIQNTESTKTIDELKMHNQKLFLKLTDREESKEEEDDGSLPLDELVELLTKKK